MVLHGELTPKHNPGPKTEKGKFRQKMGSWRHGRRSKEAADEQRAISLVLKECKLLFLFPPLQEKRTRLKQRFNEICL